jgi:peptidoglycan/LPS O-acetylase OafA/YrhL
MNQSKKYFKSLTGVRATAAFMVYVHHLSFKGAKELSKIIKNHMKKL